MAAITSDTTDRVATIIGDTLNGWFQPRYDDWYDEDYLEAWIVWDGDYAHMDHSRTITLYQFVEPLLDDLGIDLRLHPHFIARWEWEPNKERILK